MRAAEGKGRSQAFAVISVISSAAIVASGASKLILGEILGATPSVQQKAWFTVFLVGLLVGYLAVQNRPGPR